MELQNCSFTPQGEQRAPLATRSGGVEPELLWPRTLALSVTCPPDFCAASATARVLNPGQQRLRLVCGATQCAAELALPFPVYADLEASYAAETRRLTLLLHVLAEPRDPPEPTPVVPPEAAPSHSWTSSGEQAAPESLRDGSPEHERRWPTEMQLRVVLPRVQRANEVEALFVPDLQQVVLKALHRYAEHTAVPLPYPVDAERSQSSFSADEHTMLLTLRVLSQPRRQPQPPAALLRDEETRLRIMDIGAQAGNGSAGRLLPRALLVQLTLPRVVRASQLGVSFPSAREVVVHAPSVYWQTWRVPLPHPVFDHAECTAIEFDDRTCTMELTLVVAPPTPPPPPPAAATEVGGSGAAARTARAAAA